MCIQDFRIARQLDYKPITATLNGTTAVSLVPGNAGRFAVAVTALSTGATSVKIGVRVGTTIVGLAEIPNTGGSVLLKFTDFGPILWQELFVVAPGANATVVNGFDITHTMDAEQSVGIGKR